MKIHLLAVLLLFGSSSYAATGLSLKFSDTETYVTVHGGLAEVTFNLLAKAYKVSGQKIIISDTSDGTTTYSSDTLSVSYDSVKKGYLMDLHFADAYKEMVSLDTMMAGKNQSQSLPSRVTLSFSNNTAEKLVGAMVLTGVKGRQFRDAYTLYTINGISCTKSAARTHCVFEDNTNLR